MATTDPTPSNADLASQLMDVADAIENPAMHETEHVIRAAAERLRRTDDAEPLVPKLVAEFRRIAFNALDTETKRSLQSLLGEMG
jgi:hypothetical protein